MKFLSPILVLFLFFGLSAKAQEAEVRSSANQYPNELEQANLAQFLAEIAPVLVIPDYRPAIDKPIRMDHIEDGVFDAKRAAVSVLEQADALNQATETDEEAVVYYDYFEARGMLSAAFTFYRPLDDKPGDRHAHDAGSAVLSFVKSAEAQGFGLEDPSVLDSAEFFSLVANSHGDPLMGVPSDDYSEYLTPNFSQRTFWLRDIHEKLIREQGKSQVLDMSLGRAAIASVSKIHSLVGASKIKDMSSACEQDERVAVFIPVDDGDLKAKIIAAIPCAEIEVYSLEMLAPVIHDHADSLLAKKRKDGSDAYTTRCQFDPTMEDAYGNVLSVCSYPTEMQNEEGVAGGANAHYGWGMVTRFDKTQTKLELSRGDGKKASQRTDWSNYHEIIRFVFPDVLPETVDEQKASELYFNLYTEL